jgi:flagellar biosynthesis protein FlhA
VIITLVNIVGGLAIGVVEHGMAVEKALGVYARLTIGDGLSSAVPALLVSVATGLLISRSSQSVDLSAEFGRQFAARPHVLAITGVFLALLSLTDLPFLPLAAMAAAMFAAAVWTARSGRRSGRHEPETDVATDAAPASAARGLFGDERIVVELGRGLLRLVSGERGELVAAVGGLRGRVAADLGFVVPEVLFRDDLRLPDRGYRITIAGEPVAEEELPAGRLLVVPPAGESLAVEGTDATDWLGGRRCVWAGHAQAEAARRRGATVLDDTGCVARALEGTVRRHAARLLSREDVAKLVESLRGSQPALVAEVVPEVLSIATIQRTLQCLLAEGVPVRPLSELVEIMSDHASEAAEPWQLAEIVRRRLAGTICRRARDPQGRLTAVRLAGAALDACLGDDGEAAAKAPTKVVAEVRRAVRVAVERGGPPVILVPGPVRRPVRLALVRSLPALQVLAEEEVADEPRLEVFATVGGEEVVRAA